MTGRFFIIDQSLRDTDGHHYEMSRHVSAAAATLGMPPRVAAHRDFDMRLAFGDTPVDPWFARTWVQAHQSEPAQLARRVLEALPPLLRAPALRAASAARRALPKREVVQQRSRLGDDVVAYLGQHGAASDDHVFVHTLGGGELWALLEAIAGAQASPTVHVVLRRDATEQVMNKDVPGGLAGLFMSIAETPILQAKVRIYTDTHALTAQHAALHPDVPVRTLPIPIPPIRSDIADAPRAPGPLRLVYLGNARTEKGFHLLPAVLSAMHSLPPTHLIAQAHSAFSLNEHKIEDARRMLRRSANVTLIETSMASDAYDRLLAEADIVLLPYNAHDYRRRSSGILIQALAAGKPVVVPNQSWLAETAPDASAVRFDSDATFAEAVADAVRHFDAIDCAAKADALRWRASHSPLALVQTLLASV